MQTAFFFRLFFPPPAAAPEIFAFSNSACARGAADTWEAFIMQSIIGDIIFFDVFFYFIQAPVKNGVKFDEFVGIVPFHIIHKMPVH